MAEALSGKVLLIAEADGPLWGELRSSLSRRGLSLEVQDSVSEAARALKGRPGQYRAAILDTRRSGEPMQGDAGVRVVIDATPGLPVIAIGTEAVADELGDAVSCMRAGAVDFVPRGRLDAATLDAALVKAVAYAHREKSREEDEYLERRFRLSSPPAFLTFAPEAAGDRHVCAFALRLRGLASQTRGGDASAAVEQQQVEWIRKLTTSLHLRERECALEVRYLATPRDGSFRKTMVTVYLVGLGFGRDEDSAKEVAEELWSEAKPLVRLGDDLYTFAVVDAPDDLRVALRPFRPAGTVGVAATMGRLVFRAAASGLGFMGDPLKQGDVVLDLPLVSTANQRPIRPLLEVLRGQQDPTQVVVRITSGRFDEAERAVITHAKDQVLRMPSPAWRLETGDGVTLASADHQEPGAAQVAALLMRLGDHYEVDCWIEGAGTIGRTFAGLLADAIFAGDSHNRIVEPWTSEEIASREQAWGVRFPDVPIEQRLHKCLPVDHAWTALRLPRLSDGEIAGIDSIPLSYGYFPVDLPNTGMRVGEKRTASGYFPVLMNEQDRLRHTYILGQTGTGKSTLLGTMAIQDMEEGRGLSVLDPHGDLVDELLAAVPRERIDDVILFDPSDVERPVGLNLLEYDRRFPHQKTFIINEMITIFEDLYDLRVTGGPMFETYLRNAMLLLMGDESFRPTLLDVSRVFVDKKLRDELLQRCPDEMVKLFWKQATGAGGDAALSNMVPYITSKLNQFISNDIIRPIISQDRSAIDFRDVLDSRKLLLVKLVKGYVGEMTAALIGMVFVMRIMAAALSRVGSPASERRPHYLYIDEFQSFTSRSVPQMLAEVRKYGLALTLANQNLFQLKDATLHAVLGNVGTTLFFRPGPVDAERILPYVEPNFTKIDLVTLPNFTIIGRLLADHAPTPAFMFNTAWRPRPIDSVWVAEVRERSRIRYGKSVDLDATLPS